MKTIVFDAVHSPIWADSEHSAVTLQVKVAAAEQGFPFTASPDDSAPYGVDLYCRAIAGEFGPVAAYIPPTPHEMAASESPRIRSQLMKLATEQAFHGFMMGDAIQTTAWRSYYRALYTLEQTPEWPQVTKWPDAPHVGPATGSRQDA